MKSRIIIIFIFLQQINSVYADDARYRTIFKSSNELFEFKFDGNNSWNLTDTNGNFFYTISDSNYTSMTAFIANDGRQIVIIDDWIYRYHNRQSQASMWFFKKGKLTRSFQLSDLIDSCYLEYSTSHINWVIGCIVDSFSTSLILTTSEFYEYRFDFSDSVKLIKSRPAEFKAGDDIVFGDFHKKKIGKEKTTMNIRLYITDRRFDQDSIKFTTKSYGNGDWTQTLLISNGKDITPERYRNRCFYNTDCVKFEK